MAFLKHLGVVCLAELIYWANPWRLLDAPGRCLRLLDRRCGRSGFLILVVLAIVLLPAFQQELVHIRQSSGVHVSKFFAPHECEQVFPTPPELRHHVAFWKNVFGRYTTDQVVLHDSWYFQLVYAVVDRDQTPNLNPVIRKYRRLLRSLARKEQAGALETLTPEEQRVYNLFADIPGEHKFTKAAARPMRAQPGLHEHFRDAIRTSGLYQQKFIEIFEAHDLPLELTRLPFVESFFKYSAYSSAGAAGVWQFIPSTARLYGLRMTRAVDERYDPFKSAESAARLLKANYAIFETWPLAITAYNHGPAGLRRAVKQLGTTDFGKIATTYRGKRFGFYSRNYYAQFLAVVQIMQQPRRYFDEVESFPPLEYEEIRLTHGMYVNDLVQLLAISKEDLTVLNRDLKRATLQSKTPIPKNYVLKLPPGKKQQLLSELAQRSAVTS